LGTLISNDSVEKEIQRRILAGNRTYFATLSSATVSSGVDFYPELLKLYKTLIRPVVLYVVEAWTLMKKEEQALLIFERKIFRRIYGPKYENGEWKSQTNQELEEMNKGENIVKWIKGQRISWLGHLEKMEENRIDRIDIHSRTGRDKKKGKSQEKMERESRKRSLSAGSEKMERVGGR